MIHEHEMLRTAMTAIHNQGDAGLLPASQSGIDTIADEVLALPYDKNDADTKAWRRAAIATQYILRNHDEWAKKEWLAAYADLPPMEIPDRSD
jgi:hypothetical protein